MEKNKYKDVLVEVDEVLNNISKVDYDKIPEDVLDLIHNNKNKDYEWKYDFSKTLIEQNLMDESYEIISYIFKNFLIDENTKEKMKKDKLEFKLEMEKLKEGSVKSYDEMFSNMKNVKSKDVLNIAENEFVNNDNIDNANNSQLLKKSFFQLIKEKIIRIFCKNKI